MYGGSWYNIKSFVFVVRLFGMGHMCPSEHLSRWILQRWRYSESTTVFVMIVWTLWISGWERWATAYIQNIVHNTLSSHVHAFCVVNLKFVLEIQVILNLCLMTLLPLSREVYEFLQVEQNLGGIPSSGRSGGSAYINNRRSSVTWY